MKSTVDVFEEWWRERVALLEPSQLRTAKFWDVKTAAFVVDQKEANTMRSWYNEGKVEGLRLGGTILIVVASLKGYLKKCNSDR